jgi:formylglycine-generating enzyme required for sulfatase activity
MELVLIPAGEFMMGTPGSETGRLFSEEFPPNVRPADWVRTGKPLPSWVLPHEGPAHRVRFSKPFYMGRYEVTQAQWQAVMGNNPSYFKGSDDLPVEQVSWSDCRAFCRRLSEKTGRNVRLPTEAKWEYACRAGGTGKYCFGDSEGELIAYGWFRKNSGHGTHPVGGKKPNAWGLHDMHGNVSEWCRDWYGEKYYQGSPDTDPKGPSTGQSRVLRGGSWANLAFDCRSANREARQPLPLFRPPYNGFRVVVIAGVD